MRKFSRREKRILKLLLGVCLIALVLEVDARFRQTKADLVLSIENQRATLNTYFEKLKTDTSLEDYRTKTTDIETSLEQFRDRILELPRETDATLLIKENMDKAAKELGMSISSISTRSSKELVKGQPMRVLQTYFAFDTDLESLLEFFDAMSQQQYFLSIDVLNLGTRQRISSRQRRRNTKIQERPPLNGNALLTTLFLPNEEGSFENYLNNASTDKTRAPKPGGETEKDAMAPAQAQHDSDPETPNGTLKRGALRNEEKIKSSPVPLIDGSEEIPDLNMDEGFTLDTPETQEDFNDPEVEEPVTDQETNSFKNNLILPPRPLTDTSKPIKRKRGF